MSSASSSSIELHALAEAACANGREGAWLASEAAERHAFDKRRRRIWRATLIHVFRESLLRMLLVAALTAAFWAVMYVLFHEAFSLLRTTVAHPPTLARTVHAVYNVFFLSLLVMLSVSSGILYYAAIYKSPEVNLLLTLPIRPSRIASDKFLEATVLACWGFLLLGSPLLVSYGVVNQAPAAYFVFLLPLLVSFSVIPASLGALGCLLLVSVAPRFRRLAIALLIATVSASLIYLLWIVFGGTRQENMNALWLQTTLARLRLAEQRILPSWWLSTGLLEAAHGGPRGTLEACGFQCVLLSNAILLPRIVSWFGGRTLRRSFAHLVDSPRFELHWRLDWLDRLSIRLLKPISPAMRLVLVKDLRLFRRDPLQWSQFLLFFGLLSFYFIYVRRFDYGAQLTGWMTVIGFMNLGVVGLILSTFTTRFVFPLISMEGQRFWILGTSPIERRDILWSKFVFATMVTAIPCCSLVLLSDIALQLASRTPLMVMVHQVVCIMLATGLSALSVGMGARLPNLREPSPAKIAAGFGGTLTLILSALFVLCVVIPPAVPAYLMYADDQLAVLPGSDRASEEIWFAAGLVISTCVTALAVTWPLRIGFRAFQRLEL